MDNPSVTCTRCESPLGPNNLSALAPCPSCGTPLEAEVFPAMFRPIVAAVRGENVLIEGESSCFYHPQKKAVVPCDVCGRFLCALCDVDLNGQHVCPACLTSGKQKGRLPHLENRRVLYDNIALGLALLPILLGPLALFTSPAAIYVVVRYWNAPSSILPRTKARMILALVFAPLTFGLAAWMAYKLFKA